MYNKMIIKDVAYINEEMSLIGEAAQRLRCII